MTVTTLRELFRNLQAFWALYETEGIDEVESPDGETYCLFDVLYLYKEIRRLPPRQRQAIELCLVQNMKESDAAQVMGVSATNPVAMYATSGLEKLIAMVRDGSLNCFQEYEFERRGSYGHS